MKKKTYQSEYAACQVCGMRRRVRSIRGTETCRLCRNLLKHRIRRADWMKWAACASEVHHPNWWTGDEAFVGLALHVCRTQCPVRAQCLKWAMDNDETDNIYGGLTPAMRAKRAKVAV